MVIKNAKEYWEKHEIFLKDIKKYKKKIFSKPTKINDSINSLLNRINEAEKDEIISHEQSLSMKNKVFDSLNMPNDKIEEYKKKFGSKIRGLISKKKV